MFILFPNVIDVNELRRGEKTGIFHKPATEITFICG